MVVLSVGGVPHFPDDDIEDAWSYRQRTVIAVAAASLLTAAFITTVVERSCQTGASVGGSRSVIPHPSSLIHPAKPTVMLPLPSSWCHRLPCSPRCYRIRSRKLENLVAAEARAFTSSSMDAAEAQVWGGEDGQEKAMKLLFMEMGVGYDQDITATVVRA
ncbi:hypothetical protein GUJ93_ZPchr0002g23643 [Zizania palustris]|uniref:Uncharacterized protein n=1 Tax=Zizania palustris TaxID=103762 RepID=A0A8J5SND1_ZIZPA|nr:hypothetical protein GUJ93_ZPchr0002g23643 [Zizania palustris]